MSVDFRSKFLYKNMINDANTIETSGTGLIDNTQNKIKLFDRNEEIPWSSLGSTTGNRIIKWTPTNTVSITRIWLQNINWKTFKVLGKLYNEVYSGLLASFINNAEKNLYLEVYSDPNNKTPWTLDDVRFEVSDTFISGDVAKCGQIYIGNEIIEIPIGGDVTVIPDAQQFISKLSDGTSYKNYIRSIKNYSLKIQCVDTDSRDAIKQVFEINRYEAISFVPRPATSPDKWNGLAGHYNITSAPDYDNYTGGCIINGYDVNMTLTQACGIA